MQTHTKELIFLIVIFLIGFTPALYMFLHKWINIRTGRPCRTCMWFYDGMVGKSCTRPHPTLGIPSCLEPETERDAIWPLDTICGRCGVRGRYHKRPADSTIYPNDEFTFGGSDATSKSQ